MGFDEFFRHLMLVGTVLLGILGVPMPFGVPPLPEDPALLRVAPATSIAFVSWFGTAAADPKSGNRSERLAAEPEVRAALQALANATRGLWLREVRADDARRAAVASLFEVGTDLLQRPGCVFLVDAAESFGIVVRAGDDAPRRLEQLLAALQTLNRPRGTLAAKLPGETVGGVEFQVCELGARVRFAAIDGYLAIAAGDGTAEAIVAGLRGAQQGLADLPAVQAARKTTGVVRPCLRTWLAPGRLHAALGDKASRRLERFLTRLGLVSATGILAESGLDERGFTVRMHVAVDKPAGLLGALRGRPLSQDDLAPVPADATIALALRLADGALEGAMLDVASAVVGADIERDYDRFRGAVDANAGVRWREDLLAHGQDCAVAWSAPSQGGLLFTSAVGVVPLRDGKAFAASMAQMWEKVWERAPHKEAVHAAGGELTFRAYLERFEHRGVPVWWADLVDRDFPFAHAWASTPQHFVIGLQPQAVRSAIDASLQPDFDKALVRSPAVSKRGNATALLHLDLRGILQQGYGALLVLFQGTTHEWQREGFDFDLADLPRLQSLLPHLGSELLVLEPVADGFALTRTGSLPVFDPLLVGLVGALLSGR